MTLGFKTIWQEKKNPPMLFLIGGKKTLFDLQSCFLADGGST